MGQIARFGQVERTEKGIRGGGVLPRLRVPASHKAMKDGWVSSARDRASLPTQRLQGRARAADVGERIRAARETAGLSQRDQAARMGTSQAAVARLEAGGVGATLTTLHRVAAALGLEPRSLTTFRDLLPFLGVKSPRSQRIVGA